MALSPENERHAAQILAGTEGRKKGHKFERVLTDLINGIDWQKESFDNDYEDKHIIIGNPPYSIVSYIVNKEDLQDIRRIKASWLGGLATSGEGDLLKDNYGNSITKSKSDILLEFEYNNTRRIIGLSVKSCNNRQPTNAQLYFSTASAFSSFLRKNGIDVSNDAEIALKMFCGDDGYKPIDTLKEIEKRQSDSRRWFWEELPEKDRLEWKNIFKDYQDDITRLLLQKAYKDDPYPPRYVAHKTKKADNFKSTEIGIYTIDELIDLSKEYSGFVLKPYYIRKGTYKNDPNQHLAPRFGIVQMQRGGQKQHPTQLQFNLEAGYFYKLRTLYSSNDNQKTNKQQTLTSL